MRTLTTLALALVAATASAHMSDDCSYSAPRSASLPVAGATSIRIIGRAGELKVRGARAAAEVRASGTACTFDKGSLDRITLTATREGSTIRIEANVPEVMSFLTWGHHGLDFEVTVPDNIPLRIDDSSGEITIDHVGGRLTIEDSSGSIDVEDAGDVEIPSDGSGSVDIRHVKRNVTVGSKGSGSVSVEDVGGDLTVRSKGSGHVQYDDVRGKVDVPRRHRDRD